MTILHAPASGVAKPLDVLAAALGTELGPHQGLAIMPIAGKPADGPETVVVAVCAGTLTAIDENGYALVPAEQSPPVPSCDTVVVRVVGGGDDKRRVMVDLGAEVEAGEQLLRWRANNSDPAAYVVEVVNPEGDVLCDLLEVEVHTAEPLLEILGPAGEELSPVVALEPDGSVTPKDTAEASELTAAGRAPGQKA